MTKPTKNLLLTYLFVLIACLMATCSRAHGITPQDKRALLHVGVGAGAYAATYYLWRQIISNPEDKWVCHLFTSFMMATAAASWELQHIGPNSTVRPSGRDFGNSMLGAGIGAVGTIVIDF